MGILVCGIVILVSGFWFQPWFEQERYAFQQLSVIVGLVEPLFQRFVPLLVCGLAVRFAPLVEFPAAIVPHWGHHGADWVPIRIHFHLINGTQSTL